jgi:DNA-binding transcriptional MerR regulator
MVHGFTRQETIALTGMKSGKLSYYDETQLVVPAKHGNPKRPKVFYSAEQVLQLKVIQRLRERLSLQEIREVIGFLKERDYKPTLFECNLVFVGTKLYLIENWEDFGMMVLEASGKGKGQIIIHQIGPIGDVISDLEHEAEESTVPDYKKRTEGTPLEVNV